MLLSLIMIMSNLLAKDTIRVGSKTFTESYILSEIIAQTIEDAGEVKVARRFGLAGTGITSGALINDEIDIYPEYTGTITEVIIKKSHIKSIDEINAHLPKHLKVSTLLGFNNTYALAVTENFAKRNKIYSISDLKKKKIHAGFSHEFIKRRDGLKALNYAYDLKFDKVQGFEHALLYNAIKNNDVDVIEVYSTDGKITEYNLKILDDDLNFFPQYFALLFYNKRLEQYPKTLAALQKLENRLDNKLMQKMNAAADLDGKSFVKIVHDFLKKKTDKSDSQRLYQKLSALTWQHSYLVVLSLAISIFIGVPLGILCFYSPYLAQIILIFTGVLQTIPSLALLCFLLPIFGIGTLPTLVALFLYGLLPIVRNTYLGFTSISKQLSETADVLGLTFWQKLFLVQMPMAAPSILSGIKTSGVINVGMATLAAFIGAGGYGTLIVTGLALNDNSIILQGAIPSALMAILVHILFEMIEKITVSKGLRVF